MKKQLSRVLALVLVLTMVTALCPLTALAEGDKLILKVDTATALIGSSVDVKVSVENNPGISGLQMELEYDEDVLTLNTVTYTEDSVTGLTSQPSQKLTSPVKLTFYNGTADSTYNGVVATLNFTVKEGAKEQKTALTITADEDSVANIKEENVPFETANGSIIATNYIAGDINNDRKVNIKDLIRLAQYLADWDVETVWECLDTNGDGKETVKDLIRLAQYLAEWDVELCIRIQCKHENLTAVDAKAATCVSTGNTAYWVCDDCGKYFSDSAAATEITLESTVTEIDPDNHEHTEVVPAKAPTETETGYTEGVRCTDCGGWVIEPVIIPIPLEHSIIYNIAGNDTYLQSMAISNPNPTEYVTGETCNLVDLHVDGYTFDGWYTESGDKITQIPSTANEDYVLTAKWSKITYTVQFNVSMIDPEQRDLLVINKNAEGTAKNEYTSDKAWVLPALTMDTYTFVGWSDQNGNFYTDNVIPKGTTGDLILKDNWVSQRNRAVAKTTLDEPLVVEDLDNQILYFTYEIGTIENVPLYTTQELNCVNGIVTIVEKTVTHSITEEDMQKLGTSFTTETTDSTQFELSQEITDATITTENYGKSETEINELTETQAKSQSSTQSFNTSSGGSSQTYQYNDKTTKDETNQSYVLNTNLDAGMSTELTTELKNTTEVSAGVSFPIDIIKVDAGVKNTTEVSVGTDTKAYVDSSIGTESTWDNYTYEEDYQASSTTNNAYWNTDSGYTTAQQSSSSATISEAIHETISSTYEYGKTYSEVYGNKSQRGTTSATGNTTDNVASFTYTTADIESTTVGLQTTGKTYGNYRMIMAGTMHVFAVVGYDVAKQDYFVYTYYVMGDGTKNDGYKEIMDYSYDRSFADWESTVIPFTVPEYVIEYVGSRTTYTEGLEYDFDNANHTATVEAYTGNDPFVYIPSYMVDSEGTAFRVTGFTSNAFQGKNIIAISLGKFITEIPDSAFKGCSSLEYIVCPRVTSIGNEAFSGCTSMKAFEIPEETTSVGTEAFKDVPEIKATVHQYEENETVVMDSATIAENIASSGAKSITLDISNVPTEDTINLAVSNCDSFVIDGGNKTFTELSIDSSAAYTKLSRISFVANSDTPVKLASENVTMYMVSISNDSYFDVMLSNETTNLTLSGTNSIVSATGRALLCKSVTVLYENSGKLNVTGDIYSAGTVTDANNRIIFTAAEPAWEIKPITEEELDTYQKGEATILFDANEGTVETKSKSVYVGSKIGELPTPTRDYYQFDGWYTSAEGGELVTSDTSYTTMMNITVYAHWSPNEYTVSWNNCTGANIIVNLESSPVAGAECGTLTSGSTVHYGDVITVSYTSTGSAYYIASNGSTQITVDRDITSADIWVSTEVYSYTVTWNQGSHTSISVSRTSSPYAGAETGQLSNGATVYYGDTLLISYGVDTGYSLGHGISSATVTGNIDGGSIYSNATVNGYAYNVHYRSTNGTNLGDASVCYNFGTTNTIYPPAISGYDTPGAQTIAWDSTTAKDIYFYYSPISQPTYQSLCTGTWWDPGEGYGITYSVAVEYRNRTANSVEAHIIWTQSIKGACYGQNQYFNGSIGNAGIGDTLIASSSTWYNGTTTYYYTGSVTADSGWVTLSADATATSVGVSGYWWDAWRNGTWGGTLYIPTY